MILIRLPFRLIVCGSSNCGKSYFVSQLLTHRDKIFQGKIGKILYCCMYETSIPENLKQDKIVEFHRGLPTQQLLDNADMTDESYTVVVVDDLLESAFKSSDLSTIFSQVRH